MRLWWIVLGCLTAISCDKLLSFDRITLTDAELPTHYTVSYTVRTVAGGSDGVEVVDADYDPATFILRMADGTSPAIARTATGRYEFDASAQPYEIELLRQQDPYTSRFQHAATDLHLVESVIGRLDAVVPTMPTSVDFTKIPITSGSYSWALYATGEFQNVSLGLFVRGSQPIDWQTAAKNTGLVDYRKSDRLYYTEYDYDGATQWGYIGAASEFDSVLMQQGSGVVNDLGSAAPMPLSLRSAHAVAPLATELQRILPTLPAASTGMSVEIGVVALASEPFALASAMILAGRTLGANPVDIDAQIQFADPVQGTVPALAYQATWTRSLQVPQAVVPYTFTVRYAQVATPFTPTGSAGETANVGDGQLGVISDVAIAGVGLGSDNTSVNFDTTASTQLTWSVASGHFDSYAVELFELSEFAGFTYPAYIDKINTVTPSATLPPNLMRPGHYYVIVLDGLLGVPGAAQGDFSTRGFPSGFAVVVPGTFLVALPPPPR